MDHRIPKTGMAVSIGLAVAGPDHLPLPQQQIRGARSHRAASRDSFELTAEFESTKKLPTKQPVLYKGISIGRVNGVAWDPEKQVSVVTFTLDDDFEIHDDAVLQIGERSLIGDPYLNLLSRGSDASPRARSRATRWRNTEPSVDFDEALDVPGRGGPRRTSSR